MNKLNNEKNHRLPAWRTIRLLANGFLLCRNAKRGLSSFSTPYLRHAVAAGSKGRQGRRADKQTNQQMSSTVTSPPSSLPAAEPLARTRFQTKAHEAASPHATLSFTELVAGRLHCQRTVPQGAALSDKAEDVQLPVS